MSTFLGLLAVAAFIVLVISLAAAITWLVVKISPSDKDDATPEPRTST
jgi:hypothetical protein